MRTRLISSVGLLGLAVAVAALFQAPRPVARTLADSAPSGPLLFLEAKDFSSLLRDWKSSAEKQLWMDSDNYRVFSRSRLFLRLSQAYDEFAQTAGFSPDLSMLETVAGGESALALYDIGKLEFLYLTKLPSARAVESVLWRTRGSYEPRSAAGLPFYVRTDLVSRRLVAFATHDDLLLLATREDLLAGALALIAGGSGSTLKAERWYDQSVRAAGPAGDLRLVMNLEPVIRSPYFRSYWIQRNVSELRQYWAGISDLYRSPASIREERVLLRSRLAAAQTAGSAQGGASAAGELALAELLRFIPDDAGFYCGWAEPKVENVVTLLEHKVIAPHPGRPPASQMAPWLSAPGEAAGSEADLEIRIDEMPLDDAGGKLRTEPLEKMLRGQRLDAMLELQSSRVLPDAVFVGTQSAVLLMAGSDWDPDSTRNALAATIGNLWTSSRLGVNWIERGRGAHSYYQLDGLARIAMATRGHMLFVADTAEMLTSVLERINARSQSRAAVYVAGFRHARERENFARMMKLIDHTRLQPSYLEQAGTREPQFFSENIASLSRTLGRVHSVTTTVRDSGSSVYQTVNYRLTK